jgi:hypothetical protein
MKPISFFWTCLVAVATLIALGHTCDAQTTTTNGTVTFQVGGSKTGGSVMTTLTVKKAGKKELVNGNPGQDQVDGRGNFPKNSTTAGIGAYYKLILKNAGWVEGTDFTISGGQINFHGVEKLDGGASNKEVSVNGSTLSKAIVFQAVTPKPLKKKVKFERNGAGQDGNVTFVAFGIEWDMTAHTITTSVSEVKVHFLAGDTGPEVLQKILDGLVEAGWNASIDGGWLAIDTNSEGHDVYALWHSITYVGEGSNEDHWVFVDEGE